MQARKNRREAENNAEDEGREDRRLEGRTR
jgi:hypothetical protein